VRASHFVQQPSSRNEIFFFSFLLSLNNAERKKERKAQREFDALTDTITLAIRTVYALLKVL
jgi:hypothetical protein